MWEVVDAVDRAQPRREHILSCAIHSPHIIVHALQKLAKDLLSDIILLSRKMYNKIAYCVRSCVCVCVCVCACVSVSVCNNKNKNNKLTFAPKRKMAVKLAEADIEDVPKPGLVLEEEVHEGALLAPRTAARWAEVQPSVPDLGLLRMRQHCEL